MLKKYKDNYTNMLTSKKISVLVTGIGGGGLGEQVLKALKLAKSYRIVATDVLPASMGFYEADAHYLVPLASEKNYLKKILEICLKENIQVLIPDRPFALIY